MASLDPLGLSSYLISKSSGKLDPLELEPFANSNSFHTNIDYGSSEISEKQLSNNQDVVLNNGKIGIIIDGVTGFLKAVQMANGETVPLVQSFWYYQATSSYSGEKPSGAYAFNPSHKNPYIVNTKASYKVYRGSMVDEVHQVFTDWCTQVIRLYKKYNYIEFDWVIGPIPTGLFPNESGLEIITRYETNFRNKRMFYTDANGRETIRRTRDFRSSWDLHTNEEVASNYYPITSWTFIRDLGKDLQMTVLTDRSQGGASMLDGSLELMLHRRLLFDDSYGVDEALNEPGHDYQGLIVRGKHRLVVDAIQDSVRFLRKLSKTTSWTPIFIFRNTPSAHSAYLVNNLHFVGLREKLPANIHLLSLEQWNDEQVLIRLEHFYEINEDFKYSRETQVNLSNLFATFVIVDVEETNLSGTRSVDETERTKLSFISESNPYENYTSVFSSIFSNGESNGLFANLKDLTFIFPLADSQTMVRKDKSFSVMLKPMQIRTFLVRLVVRN